MEAEGEAKAVVVVLWSSRRARWSTVPVCNVTVTIFFPENSSRVPLKDCIFSSTHFFSSE
jgi:hypothetical protein